MKWIEPKAEIINGIPTLQKIALIARVCTGTQDKAETTPEAALQFCKKLVGMGHLSPFEHARIVVPLFEFKRDFEPYLTNAQLCRVGTGAGFYSINVRDYLSVCKDLERAAECEDADDCLTVCFTIDIGIARELVRHRTMSFMERSTRWCSWSEENGGIEFIKPENYYENHATQTDYRHAFELAESFYFGLLKRGVRREFARSVLPLATATKLYVTGTEWWWMELLRLRLGKRAHPAMRRVMKMLVEQADCPEGIRYSVNKERLNA